MISRPDIERIVRETVDRLVRINVSARHLHITQDHLEVLFGSGHTLTRYKELMQPGEFASAETVTVVGPNRRVFEKVRILGPTRSQTQVELSFNDGRYIGLDLPARISGNIKGSLPIVLVGPEGALQLREGAIRALRHIHIGEAEAMHLGLKNGETVQVKTHGAMAVTFENVVIRVGSNAVREMHIDTDEGNAAGLPPSALGLLV